jgi:hypothetical protein
VHCHNRTRKGLQTIWESIIRWGQEALGKDHLGPNDWMSVGRHLWGHSWWNSYQNLGLIHGLHHIPHTAGVQAWPGQISQVLYY